MNNLVGLPTDASFHLNFGEQGLEELYDETPEPAVLQGDVDRLDDMTDQDKADMDAWLADVNRAMDNF